MSCSAYTVNVSSQRPDNTREVSLLHEGCVTFTVTHRDVLWAVLARFSHLNDTDDVGLAPDILSNSPPDENNSLFESDRPVKASHALSSSAKPSTQYLCVFHCEELHDSHGRYTIAQPNTVCTTYAVGTATTTQFVLLHIQPSDIVPGERGIFVHGQRQSARGPAVSQLELEGLLYLPAADLWWMASPLVVKPVFVCMGMGSAAGRGCDGSAERLPNPSPWFGASCESRTGVTESFNSRSVSPSLGLASAATVFQMLNTTVIAQFRVVNERLLTVVRCEGDMLGLAETEVHEHLDILTWKWWPHRLRLPSLRAGNASVSLTVSEHPLLEVQTLFLYCTQAAVIHVVCTPNLRTGDGALQHLFTLNTNGFPAVLHCLRATSPQPILICNCPAANEVALFDPVSVSTDPCKDNFVVSMPLRFNKAHRNSQPRSAVEPRASSNERANSLHHRQPLAACERVADGSNCHLDGIVYQSGPKVAFRTTRAPSFDGDSPTPRSGRSEIVDTTCVKFPSVSHFRHPFVTMVLDTLEAAAGHQCASGIEYALIRRAWESRLAGRPFDMLRDCVDLLVKVVKASVSAAKGGDSGGTPSNVTTSGFTSCTVEVVLEKESLFGFFSDPSRVTAQAVEYTVGNVPTPGRCNATHDNAVTRVGGREPSLLWSMEICGICLLSLHLLSESCKIQERLWPLLKPLAELNRQLSSLMGWPRYMALYDALQVGTQEELHHHRGKSLRPSGSVIDVVSVDRLHSRFSFYSSSDVSSIQQLCTGTPPLLYLALRRVLQRSVDTLRQEWPILRHIPPRHPIATANRLYRLLRDCFDQQDSCFDKTGWWLGVCRGLAQYELSCQLVTDELCTGVAYPILQALAIGRDYPDSQWDSTLHALVGRLDSIRDSHKLATITNPGHNVVRLAEEGAVGRQYCATLSDDGGTMMRPDFPKTWADSRMDGPQKLFDTFHPIMLPGHGEGTDSLHSSLESLMSSTMSLPLGRGMLTMCTQNFRVRDSIPIPKLNLNGRTTDGILVTNNAPETLPENLLWPLFHNGCAAGLRFLPLDCIWGGPRAADADADCSSTVTFTLRHDGKAVKESAITRHWVVYQTRNVQCPASRAGLLLATGILGHLKVLQLTDIYSLLVTPQSKYAWREVTTIAVMLGLSCSFRGTSNDLVFRCLSMHVQSLTPTAEEIEVSMDVQTAALVSIGLLCQRTPTNSFLVEMFLVEMSRLPSDEHCTNREGYAMGAGFGLGLLLIGLGRSHGIAGVEDRLLSFMEGDRREPVSSVCEGLDEFHSAQSHTGHFLTRALLAQSAQESCRSKCTKVYEGACYNKAISGSAAIIALGLMYLKTEDETIFRKMAPPDRVVGLQELSPTLCLLRSMMSPLIAWSSMQPSREWVYQHVPSCLMALLSSSDTYLANQQISYLMMNLGHCIAGTILALGLRFVGSMDADARSVILAELMGFVKGHIGTSGAPITPLQRSTGAFSACVSACCVAIGLVMAGTGDLATYSILEKLHNRSSMSYGAHMAISASMGLLFLGGGRLTLSNSISSVAALVLAFYPVWPRGAEDNVYHLQALRHLYGLAVVPRVMEAIDVLSNRPVSVPIRVILRSGRVFNDIGDDISKMSHPCWSPMPRGREQQEVLLNTPCLLPPPETIDSIEVRSTHHYPVTVRMDGNQSVVSEQGLVVRILEKENVCTWETGTTSSASVLLDGLNAVFRQQSVGITEALAILDNFKMLHVAQRALMSMPEPACVRDVQSVVPLDFGKAVEDTLERRYRYIFLHGPPSTVSEHPLHRLIIQKWSVHEVVRELARHPTGVAGFPCDFTALERPHSTRCCSDVSYSRPRDGSEDDSDMMYTGPPLDVKGLQRWIVEALHYYDIIGVTEEIDLALRQWQSETPPPPLRALTLLRMSQRACISISTMEKVVKCCVGSASF